MTYRFEKVAIGHKGQTLLPWAIGRLEMDIDQVCVFGAECLSGCGEQFSRHSLGLLDTSPLDVGLVKKHFAAHDFMGPFVRYVQCAQRVGQFIGVAPSCKPSG